MCILTTSYFCVGIAWRPGTIAQIVNDIRIQYTNEKRPMISSAPLDAEPDENETNMDIGDQG